MPEKNDTALADNRTVQPVAAGSSDHRADLFIKPRPGIIFMSSQSYQGFLDKGLLAIYAIHEWIEQRASNPALQPMGSDVMIDVPAHICCMLVNRKIIRKVNNSNLELSGFYLYVTIKPEFGNPMPAMLMGLRQRTDQVYMELRQLTSDHKILADFSAKLKSQFLDQSAESVPEPSPTTNIPFLLGNHVNPDKPAFTDSPTKPSARVEDPTSSST